MAKVKSELLSGYLTMAQIVKSLIDEVKNLNGNDEDIRRIETDPKVRRQIAELLVQPRPQAFAELEPWCKFYREVLNISVAPQTIRIPERVTGFDRLNVVMPGMTPERLFQLCKSRFGTWKWTNKSLDNVVTSDRTAENGPYAIWVRDCVEADGELANKSYNDLKADNVIGVTLEERLLDELEYHFRTGSHKDIQNVTLCSGSRCSDGAVLSVLYRAGIGLYVNRYGVDQRHDQLRSRQAVSLPKAV